jgi:hypothetical protein
VAATDRWIIPTPNNATGANYFSQQHRIDISSGVNETYSSLQGILIGRTIYPTNGTLSIKTTLLAQLGHRRQATSSSVFYTSQTQNGLRTCRAPGRTARPTSPRPSSISVAALSPDVAASTPCDEANTRATTAAQDEGLRAQGDGADEILATVAGEERPPNKRRIHAGNEICEAS